MSYLVGFRPINLSRKPWYIILDKFLKEGGGGGGEGGGCGLLELKREMNTNVVSSDDKMF